MVWYFRGKIVIVDYKLLKDSKFLNEVRQAALSHRDDAVPNKDPDLYMPYMWVNGVIDILKARGYKIEKDKEC